MRLAFAASSTSVDDIGCVFEGASSDVTLMFEDGRSVRLWWHDGALGEDECVLDVRIALTPSAVTIELELSTTSLYNGPYSGFDITYEDYDDRFGDLRMTFAKLLERRPDALAVTE